MNIEHPIPARRETTERRNTLTPALSRITGRGRARSGAPEEGYARRAKFRRGFSFAEVLFAIAVLGIGFIMVAAIYPVALQQTQSTVEETRGATLVRNARHLLGKSPIFPQGWLADTDYAVGTNPAPAYARVFSFRDERLTAISPTPAAPVKTVAQDVWDGVKNYFISSDKKYAYIALYSQSQGFTVGTIISVAARNTNEFTDDDLERNGKKGSQAVANLEPRPICIDALSYGGSGSDEIIISNITGADDPTLKDISGDSNAMDAAVQGAYVIVSDDRKPDDPPPTPTPFVNEYGRLNGRVYQLGEELDRQPGQYVRFKMVADEKRPTNVEEIPGPGGTKAAIGYVVGRGYADPKNPDQGPNSYSGPSMAIFMTQTPLN